MVSQAPRSGTRHASPEERRAQILAAALGCFGEKGYHAATMDDVVRASGLSKGSLYWHFRSKEEVLLALFDAFSAELFGVWDRAAAEDEPALDRLERVMCFGFEALAEQGVLLRAWAEFFGHARARERLAGAYRLSREKLHELLAQGVERGEIRALPLGGMASAVIAAMEGLLLQAMVDPAFDARPLWPTTWEILRRGLAT